MPKLLLIHLDTNSIDARGTNEAIKKLKKLYEKGKILIEWSNLIDEELQKGKGYPRGQKESLKYIKCLPTNRSIGDCSDRERFSEFLLILFGEKKPEEYSKNQKYDTRLISEAIRNSADYFVTNEKALLKKSLGIEKRFGLIICNPEDCLEQVEKRLGLK